MEKLKRSRLFNRLNSMSIRMTFVLYALFSLLIGIIICILLISMVDRYRINLNYKYENLSTRYDIPENGSFTATYSNDQTKYTIFDTKGNEICKFNVDYQKERPVHEYVYPNHVSYIEVLPNFTNRDRLIDSALGSLNIAIIPIVLSISMICCVTFLLWSSFFVTLVAKKIVLINLCCRPCFIWGSITIITVWTNMIIINVCKFFYLLIECFLCCKLIQICAFILQGIEITLHRCIVVRISCFAHALCHIYRFAEFGKCFGRIL